MDYRDVSCRGEMAPNTASLHLPMRRRRLEFCQQHYLALSVQKQPPSESVLRFPDLTRALGDYEFDTKIDTPLCHCALRGQRLDGYSYTFTLSGCSRLVSAPFTLSQTLVVPSDGVSSDLSAPCACTRWTECRMACPLGA